ncbi:hypothetical protein E2C01_040351 [Portunus trituberculatus]|uniref:Tyr recombinase domain-containing protein n=1 Tax=Portunus trituberculatus TaxID=210409 RepID=A0A5B7FNZ9_PORTR|nr:hypothetical protein [Portunus trituberculatus]
MNRPSVTVSAHSAALPDPLYFGLSITMEERALTLLRRGIRATTMPARRGAPQWSLHKVLHYVTFDGISQLQEQHYLQRAIFLLALATGYRASQIAALTRHPSFTTIDSNGKAVTLTPSPSFLAKNEQADNLIGPLRVPAFKEELVTRTLGENRIPWPADYGCG